MAGNSEHAPATRTIARAIAILQAFDETRPELGVTELGQLTDLDKSTVYRLLSALQQGGLIEQNPATTKYHLGFGLVCLASLAIQHLSLPRISHTHLEELAHQTGETVHLSTMTEDHKLIYVDTITSSRRVHTTSWIGQQVPLHAASGGKVMLAFLPAAELDALLAKPLERFTAATIVEAEQMRAALDEIRCEGYAIARDELEDGLSEVACPIRDRDEHVIATLSVSGPSFRLPPVRLTELGMETCKAANTISRKLGSIQ